MNDLPHSCFFQDRDGTISYENPMPAALLAGSFNPLHRGHCKLAEVAARLLGLPVAFEISVANVDKPELPSDEVHRRLRQFVGLAPIFVTRASTFVAKARLFPSSVFVVGYDTAVRIVDPRYYEGDPGRRDDALSEIQNRGCRFLVAGRLAVNRMFQQFDKIEIAEPFQSMFESISVSDFREDISSTELRARSS